MVYTILYIEVLHIIVHDKYEKKRNSRRQIETKVRIPSRKIQTLIEKIGWLLHSCWPAGACYALLIKRIKLEVRCAISIYIIALLLGIRNKMNPFRAVSLTHELARWFYYALRCCSCILRFLLSLDNQEKRLPCCAVEHNWFHWHLHFSEIGVLWSTILCHYCSVPRQNWTTT